MRLDWIAALATVMFLSLAWCGWLLWSRTRFN
jgi:hypothetical protein